LLLVTVEANPSADQSVCEGPMVERRLLIWRRIEKLKEQGTGVQAFEALFKDAEGSAKASDEASLSKKLTYLESKLNAQEEHVRQAKMAQQGRGIRVPKGVSSTATAATAPPATTTANQPQGGPFGGPPGGGNSGKSNRPNLWGQGNQNQEFLPPPPPPPGYGPPGGQGGPGFGPEGGGPRP